MSRFRPKHTSDL